MSIDAYAMDLMERLSWHHGTCESCGRRGSVTYYGRDEDGQPIGELCFVCTKRDARVEARARMELGL